MRLRKLIKTITYRLPVFLGAILIPRVVYGVWDFSPLVFSMAVGFTVWYYIHEALWDGFTLSKFRKIPKVCPNCGKKVTKDNVIDHKEHGIFCYFCAWKLN